MRRQQATLLIVASVFIVGLIIGIVFAVFVKASGDAAPSTKLPPAVFQSTVSYERTAIAQMTQNPELSESLTPYYGQILYNEARRNIGQNPTLAPNAPRPQCWLIADAFELNTLEDVLIQALAESYPDVAVESFVSVVWNTNECDTYLPIDSMTRIGLTTTGTNSDASCVLRTVIEAFNAQIDYASDLLPAKSRILLAITINDSVITTNLELIKSAILNSLSCNSLPDALRIVS